MRGADYNDEDINHICRALVTHWPVAVAFTVLWQFLDQTEADMTPAWEVFDKAMPADSTHTGTEPRPLLPLPMLSGWQGVTGCRHFQEGPQSPCRVPCPVHRRSAPSICTFTMAAGVVVSSGCAGAAADG